jgi:predicted O-methyltransferase YrrM
MSSKRFESIDGYASDNDQGELLRTILSKKSFTKDRPLRIAEIGVYKGRGTCLWNDILLSLKKQGKIGEYEYHAIDYFKGSTEHQKDVDYYQITLSNLRDVIADVQKDGNVIHIFREDSVEQSKTYPDGHFDIVYIDASHEYEFIRNDIKSWLPKVDSSGVICGDDYIKGWDGVIQAVNETFKTIHVIGNQQWLYYL